MVNIILPLHSQYFKCKAYFSVIVIFHSKYSKTKSSIFFSFDFIRDTFQECDICAILDSNITNAHLPLGVNIGTQYFLNVALVELCIDYYEKKCLKVLEIYRLKSGFLFQKRCKSLGILIIYDTFY